MNNEKGISPAALAAYLGGDMGNFLAASTPGGIERQEADGQRDFCSDNNGATATLPKDCPKADLEKMGVEFLLDQDDLFVNVILPDGWHKKPTGHNVWSELLDGDGKRIASIFYKAAFYDRRAFLRLKND